MAYFDDNILTARPPYIRFETRAIEKRKTAEEGGASTFVDVDFALVTSHGSKDTVEKVVSEWFPRLAEDVRQGRFNATWLKAYKDNYEAWKNNQEPPINGTSIKLWPVPSPAEVKHMLACHVRTVEDLAGANEELIGRLGMGARGLKQKAVDWLTGKNGQAPLIAQLDAMRQIIAGLEFRAEESAKLIRALEQQLQAKASAASPTEALPPVSDRLVRAQDAQSTFDADLNKTLDELLE